MKHFGSFSDAIREGITLRPRQCFNRFFEGDDASCATGAGIEAVLGRALGSDEETSIPRFMETMRGFNTLYPYMGTPAALPCGCAAPYNAAKSAVTGQRELNDFSLFNIAVYLNNFHHWTREAIAAWLESEEEKLGFVTLSESVESVSEDLVLVGV